MFDGGECGPNVEKGDGDGGDIECVFAACTGGIGARVECCRPAMNDGKVFEVTIAS